ncbi:MAG TPA: NHL repeat-containing protein [Fimbriimonadaceae bacterium]|nr:NHL repeat-containing protein [Fimbriimonadaceae bacterium]
MRTRWALALCIAFVAGCGGGSSGVPSSSGQTGINIFAVFDPATRVVPGYVGHVEVTLTPPFGVNLPPGMGNLFSLTRDKPSISLPGLQPSTFDYTLQMRAYTDGQIVGSAIATVTVINKQMEDVDVSANMQTAIKQIDVTGDQFAGVSSTPNVATARGSSNQVLFTGAGFSWGATDSSVISVDSNGNMIGLKRGYTDVVAWVNDPLISGKRLVGALGYVPTRVLLAGVGGTTSGMRDVDGSWYWTYNDPGGGAATDVAIDKQERVYMAIGTKIVRVDDLSGFGRVELQLDFTPASIDVDANGKIYMLDYNNRRIVRVDDMSGGGKIVFGTMGTGQNQFWDPASITIGVDGAIYVPDRGLSRIDRFTDMFGANWRTFGSPGSGVGQFDKPSDVDIDGNGFIYVMDSGNHRICKFFTIAGGFWTTYGTKGTGVGQFGDITFMSVEGDSFIYVHDASNDRVIRMSSIAGNFWVSFTLPTTQTGGRIEVPDK